MVNFAVGCAGSHDGFEGWSDGGSHGVVTGDGYDGGTGGGSTQVGVGEPGASFAEAGGGGGGGGDSSPAGTVIGDYTGNGGNGGPPPTAPGHPGNTGAAFDNNADGGCGGCQPGTPTAGESISDILSSSGGGGGGGGGFHGGGGGGASESIVGGGGGGGGGGSSYATPSILNPVYGPSNHAGDGEVLLSFSGLVTATTSGSKQRAQLNEEFPKPLQAKVTDSSGNPLVGVNVDFDVRGEGAGKPSGVFGLWDNHKQTERVATNADGIAQSSTLSAGINPGSWTASASVPDYDVGDSAHFQLWAIHFTAQHARDLRNHSGL